MTKNNDFNPCEWQNKQEKKHRVRKLSQINEPLINYQTLINIVFRIWHFRIKQTPDREKKTLKQLKGAKCRQLLTQNRMIWLRYKTLSAYTT